MAAVQFGTALKAYLIKDNNRSVVKTAGGVYYAVVLNNTDHQLEMWKNIDGTPANVGTNIGLTTYNPGGNPAVIDSSGLIHTVYFNTSGYPIHRTFDTATDTWGTADQIVAANCSGWELAQIELDASDVPHVLYYPNSNYHATYINKVGGSWNTPVDIAGTAITGFDIAIDKNAAHTNYNIPQITYILSHKVYMGLGNANNATAFTITNQTYDDQWKYVSIAIDTSGYTTVIGWSAWHGGLSYYITDSASWGTASNWTFQLISATPAAQDYVSLVIAGTTRYALYVDATTHNLVYLVSTAYGAWGGATTAESGTCYCAKARWQFANNPAGVDYIFTDASNHLWFDIAVAGGTTRNLTTTCAAVSTVSTPMAAITRNLASSPAAVSIVGSPILAVLRALQAGIAAESATSPPLLAVLRKLTSSPSGVSVVASPILAVTRALQSSVVAGSATQALLLAVERHLSSSPAAVSAVATPNLAVQRVLASLAAAQSEASTSALNVVRPLHSTITIQTQTQAVALAVLRVLRATIASESQVPDIALKVLRDLATAISAQSLASTPYLGLICFLTTAAQILTYTSIVDLRVISYPVAISDEQWALEKVGEAEMILSNLQGREPDLNLLSPLRPGRLPDLNLLPPLRKKTWKP